MAFLDVSASLMGRRWAGPTLEQDRLAEAMAREAGLDLALCRTLVRRGVAPDGVPAFLEPRLRDLLPDPLTLRDMAAAAERLVRAALDGQRIAVFADYDVDGGASAALLLTWLRGVGSRATLYVPDRLAEGYGPNAPAMAMLGETHDLIVCVDCGTLSHGPIAAAGCDVIVLDHHQGGPTLPSCVAVVNPNRQDETGDLGHLCAAGVVFLVLVDANRRLKALGRPGPDLMAMLDLVALATVADVAPLTGVNRALVRQGLAVMARRERPGVAALCDVAGLGTAPTCYHLGYVLGPRVNAGGRVGDATLGARLLATDDPREAQRLARALDGHNVDRREIEAGVQAAAMAQSETRGWDAPLAWAAGEGWHPGVVGIVASRLKEAARRPAVVIALEGGIGRGSARSVPGVDIGGAIARLAAEGLIMKGGGHRMAAGLTVEASRLEAAMARLSDLLALQGAGTGGPDPLDLDGVLMPRAASLDLVDLIARAGPFGAGAPSPRFALPDLAVTFARVVGGGHLKLTLTDGMGGRLDAIAFGGAEGPLARLAPGAGNFHVAGRLESNTWQGRRSVQLLLDDAAPAGRG